MSESTQLTCPKCGRIFRTPADFGEPTAPCPHCQSPVVVPYVSNNKSDPFDDLFELDAEEPESSQTAQDQSLSNLAPQKDSETGFELINEDEDQEASATQSTNVADDLGLLDSNPGSSREKFDSSLVSEDHKRQPQNDESDLSEDVAATESNDDIEIDLTDDSLLDNLNPQPSSSISESQKKDDPYRIEENARLTIEGISAPSRGKDTFSFACPICDSLLYANPNQIGQSIRCEDCHSSVEVPPPESDKPPTEKDESKQQRPKEGSPSFRNEELALFEERATDEDEDDGYSLKPLDHSNVPKSEAQSIYSTDNDEQRPDTDREPESSSWNSHQNEHNEDSADDDDDGIELVDEEESTNEDDDSKPDDGGIPTDLDPVGKYTTAAKPKPPEERVVKDTLDDEETAKRRDKKPGGAKEISDTSFVLKSMVAALSQPVIWLIGGAIWLVLTITFALLCSGTAGIAEAESGVPMLSVVGIIFGLIFLAVAVAVSGLGMRWIIESMRKKEEKVGNITKADPKELVQTMWKGAVILAAAIAPGFLAGLLLWGMTGVAGMVAIFANISMYILFPYFYVAASFNMSPVQVYSKKVINTFATRQMAWTNIYIVVGAAGVLGLLAFAINTALAYSLFAPFVAAAHAAAMVVLAVATGLLNRAIMIALDR